MKSLTHLLVIGHGCTCSVPMKHCTWSREQTRRGVVHDMPQRLKDSQFYINVCHSERRLEKTQSIAVRRRYASYAQKDVVYKMSRYLLVPNAVASSLNKDSTIYYAVIFVLTRESTASTAHDQNQPLFFFPFICSLESFDPLSSDVRSCS